jgi:hypothetical protein
LGGLSWPTGIVPYDDGVFIAVESANAITLKRAQGASDSVARDQIATIAAKGVSLMPKGLEKDVSHQGASNVISFFLSIQAPSKSQPPLPRRSDRAWSLTLALARSALGESQQATSQKPNFRSAQQKAGQVSGFLLR